MTHNTWILLCNSSKARLLQEKPKGKGLLQMEAFDHVESRAHVRDLMADANGRKPVGPPPANMVQGQGGAYGRPGAEPDTDPKEVEAQKFARQLAERLEKGLNEHAYDSLIIVATPHFLGTLRNTLSTQVEKHVKTTVDKDFTSLELHELEERLEHLRAA